ncbi:MAG: D-tyrosyl-tRNA(Tyr) deacylase [Prevotella sp.]|nr:D-tyrosyl-tRNA(Tyr) deacylase [Candidatus Equicola stercoris]
MKVVIQRVSHASVTVEGQRVASIGKGFMILLGVADDDGQEDIDWLCRKIAAMRVFDDDEGVMNLDIRQTDGEVLVVSQFTLMASTKKGNRPSYVKAARPEVSKPLYDTFCMTLSDAVGKVVQRGVFGADMKVELLNDGPVTICMDSKDR